MTKLVLPKGELSGRNRLLRDGALRLGWEIEYLDDTTGGAGLGPVYIDECTEFTEEDWDKVKELLSAEIRRVAMSEPPESKGSPGPWRSDRVMSFDNQPLYEITVGGDGVVAYVEAHDDTDRANATLIAKAPEMAAMLKELEWVGTYDAYKPSCPVCGQGQEGKVHESDCRLSLLLRALP